MRGRFVRIAAAAAFIALAPAPMAAAACVPGDLTGDNVVNGMDLAGLLAAWGGGPGSTADLNGDGTVNGLDLAQMLALWGPASFPTGVFPAQWIHGAPAGGCSPQPQPLIQVHQYNENTWILRQSKCTNFEGPFIYLLFGQDKVLMLDTGASFGGLPMATTVYGVINQWLAAHKQASIQLIVTHSHGHGDHVAHDSQFSGQPNTTLVSSSQAAVQAFFGISTWPTQIVSYDLGGGRILDVIPIPGHLSNHIAFYDRQHRLLLTGDTLYPGHLFISNFTQYKASIQRLVDFTATRPVCWVLGTHVEMTATPFVAYTYGTVYQPNEHVLQLTRDQLVELNNALIAMGASPHDEVHADFIIEP